MLLLMDSLTHTPWQRNGLAAGEPPTTPRLSAVGICHVAEVGKAQGWYRAAA